MLVCSCPFNAWPVLSQDANDQPGMTPLSCSLLIHLCLPSAVPPMDRSQSHPGLILMTAVPTPIEVSPKDSYSTRWNLQEQGGVNL